MSRSEASFFSPSSYSTMQSVTGPNPNDVRKTCGVTD